MTERHAHLTEDDLTLFHYGELEDRAAAGRHLLGCAACRAAYDELLAVLQEVDSLPVPERGEGYGAEVWERLAPRLPRRPPAWRRPWAVAAMVLLVLGAGFLAGRLSMAPGGGAAPAPIPEAARQRILRAAVGEHLERSGRVLVEIANDGSSDAAALRSEADALLGSNRLYRQSLAASGRSDLIALLDDLERVLLDVAHSTAGDSGEALDSIRARIDERGLLFKVRIVTDRLRREGRPSAEAAVAERT